MDYESFIQNKRAIIPPSGFAVDRETGLNTSLFDFQKDIVKWALMRGRAAIFAGTGLGKSRMQVEWAMNVHRLSGGDVLLLAPLAVASQTVREGAELGYEIHLMGRRFVGIELKESYFKTASNNVRAAVKEQFDDLLS